MSGEPADIVREVYWRHVLALFCEQGSGRGSGVPVHLHAASMWEVRDGKAVSYRGYLDRDEAARDAGI